LVPALRHVLLVVLCIFFKLLCLTITPPKCFSVLMAFFIFGVLGTEIPRLAKIVTLTPHQGTFCPRAYGLKYGLGTEIPRFRDRKSPKEKGAIG
jgi:hypothetical protein